MIRGVCLLKLSVNTHLLWEEGSSCKAPHITHLTTSSIRLEKCFVTTKLHLTFHQHGGGDDNQIFMFRVNAYSNLAVSYLPIDRKWSLYLHLLLLDERSEFCIIIEFDIFIQPHLQTANSIQKASRQQKRNALIYTSTLIESWKLILLWQHGF